LVNVPVPFDVHVTPALFDAFDPAVIFTAPELAQVTIAVPAVAVADAFTNTVYVAVAAAQGLFETVIVNVTVLPASPAAAV
jgi:hypothetical protein